METKVETSLAANEAHAKSCAAQSKWAALIEDTLVPAPQRLIPVSVLKAQGKVPPGSILVRDRGSDHDEILADDAVVDLGEGNVFYALPACEANWRASCQSPAKLAYFIDDRSEVTLNPNQTGQTLREWFGFTPSVNLFRDYESPNDVPIHLEDAARFTDGPVFYTRRIHAHLKIVVNKKTFTEADGVKAIMTGREIAALVCDNPDATEVFKLGKGGPEKVGLDEKVETKGYPEFRVIRCDVKGGYELARIERELAVLRSNGAEVEFYASPVPVVIYRRIPARHGYSHLQETDVLVSVPSGYPGQPLDGAYLPEGSPLLGRVVGSPQGAVVEVAGRRWQLVSYHPHNGGGAPPWNKNRHGFHTYLDEILAWVHRANN